MYNIITHYWYIIGLSIGILSLLLWGIVYFLPVIGKRVQQPIYEEENKDLIIQSILTMLLNLDEYYFNEIKYIRGKGLCSFILKLRIVHKITSDQMIIMTDYLDYNYPKKGYKFYSKYSETSGYYWPPKDIEVRRKWLIYQLDLLTNTYQG